MVGMVGGRVFFRGPHQGFSHADAKMVPIDDDTWSWLTDGLTAYLTAIDRLELLAPFADDEFAALMVANSWMGEHRKSYSRLYQKIREARSMNYGDYSYIEWYQAGGQNQLPPYGVPRSSNYWSIWIRPVQIASQLRAQYEELANVTVGHAHFALRMAIRELDLLIENGVHVQDQIPGRYLHPPGHRVLDPGGIAAPEPGRFQPNLGRPQGRQDRAGHRSRTQGICAAVVTP